MKLPLLPAVPTNAPSQRSAVWVGSSATRQPFLISFGLRTLLALDCCGGRVPAGPEHLTAGGSKQGGTERQ